MKATGIIRRIDDLGRIVIPKEIRRTHRIREGDPLELYVDKEGILFKKYSEMGALKENAALCAKALQQHFGATVLVCDTDYVVAASSNLSGCRDKPLSEALGNLIRSGKEYQHTAETTPIAPFDKIDDKHTVQMMIPVRGTEGNSGGIVLLGSDPDVPQEMLARGMRMAAALLTDHLVN